MTSRETRCGGVALLEKQGISVLRAGAELQFRSLQKFGSGMPFGITVDETTDVAVEKQLIVYIKSRRRITFHGARQRAKRSQ